MRVLAALDRCAGVVEGVEKLISQLLLHRLSWPASRGHQEPAHREGLAARSFDLHRDLVRCPADPTRLDLDDRRRVSEGLFEHFKRGPAGPIRNSIHRAIDDSLGGAFLAALHHFVDEPRKDLALIARVRSQNPALDLCPTWHIRSLDRGRGGRRYVNPSPRDGSSIHTKKR